MLRSIRTLLACLTLALGMLIAVRGAEAQPNISTELLLPYFEVELDPSGVTTLFAVGNALDEPVDIVLTLHSNWGVAVERASLKLAPHEVRSFNLRDWLSGSAPGRKLDSKQVAHLRAALSAARPPQDSMFYATSVRDGLAVGYVRIKAQKTKAALWGDYFIVDPAEKSTQGETLVAIGQGAGCPGLCARHILRYLLSGTFDAGTELIVWTAKAGKPARQPSADPIRLVADSDLYNEAGALVDAFQWRTLPVQQITLSELSIKHPFGWLDLRTEMDSFVAVRYRSQSQGSALLRTWCLPLGYSNAPGIEIMKLTNGQDANVPPGPSIPVGSPVLWEYVVRNTGNVGLVDIEVKDDQGVAVQCPKTSLSKGESMTCTGRGTAIACQYANLGSVTGRTSDGVLVSDDDPSHYFGESAASIDLEKLTNGEDADTAPGPKLAAGAAVTWTYIVRNTGDVALSGIGVSDDREGAVTCPRRSLRPGESMTCTLTGKAVAGQYRNVGTATGETLCGATVRDEDAGHYHNLPEPPAAIDIEKHTNGQDADTPKGPEIEAGQPVLWEYIVTNTGQVALTDVRVIDDRGVAVSCPKTSLNAGERMTCTGHGTAVAGQYANLGTATGKDPQGKTVTDSDPSHYFGVLPPPAAIDIKKLTNGEDADTPKGPEIEVGAPVLWEYIVTNTGQVALSDVRVTDDRGVAVSCPKTSLGVGESMTCTGRGTAGAGQYKNLGTATGKDPKGKTVTDSDPSHYYGVEPPPAAIDIKKLTNGEDANYPKGPQIEVGQPVLWEYIVTNTGQAALTDVRVSDDQGVAVSCPKTSLGVGESMTCTGRGTARAGQYKNLGTATGKDPKGKTVSDTDPSHYYGVEPKPACIDIKKLTNGEDANYPKGPEIEVGKPVLWEYIVTNTGGAALTDVRVTDDQGVAVSCPKTSLAAGESMRCTGNGTAKAGQYKNIGTVTGKDPQYKMVTDSDPSHYYGVTPPPPCSIDIEKHTNGEDADYPKGPEIEVGKPVLWEYFVTNTCQGTLTYVKVTDDQGVSVSCPKTSLAAGESMRCTGNGTAKAGQYKNIGTVTAKDPQYKLVTDSDPSHYYGIQPPPQGNQGCTPGYWKNHEKSWPASGYSTYQKVKTVFGEASRYPWAGYASLIEALSFQGGWGTEGAVGNLLRAATASLLNSAHPGVSFPRTPSQVIGDVNAALASGNRDQMLGLAAALDQDNNLGCPLN